MCLQEWSVTHWIAAGAPRRKLMLGIAAQGRSFTLQSPGDARVGAPITGPGAAGPLLQESGILGYSEVGHTPPSPPFTILSFLGNCTSKALQVCQLLSRGAETHFDGLQKFPYAYLDTLWVSYDNPRSATIKVRKDNTGG